MSAYSAQRVRRAVDWTPALESATELGRPLPPSALAWNGVPWLSIALAIALAVVQPAFLALAGLYVWALSIVVLGLPHGACDPFVLPRLQPAGWRVRTTVIFYVAYVCAAALVVLLWLASPLAGLVFFLALTMWHWGSADAVARVRGASWYIVGSLARGAIVVLGPVACHPTASAAMFARLIAVVTPSAANARAFPIALATAGPLAHAVDAVVVGAVIVELVGVTWDLRHERRRGALIGIGDLVLLLSLFLLAPPVTAVGLYFVAWHSWRHVLRVGSLFEHGQVAAGRLVARYYARAWPLTVVSVGGLVLVTVALRQQGWPQVIATYLALISALTLPHAIVVAIWDRNVQYVPWGRGGNLRSGPA